MAGAAWGVTPGRVSFPSPRPVGAPGILADTEVAVGDGAHDGLINVAVQAALAGTFVVDPIEALWGTKARCSAGDMPLSPATPGRRGGPTFGEHFWNSAAFGAHRARLRPLCRWQQPLLHWALCRHSSPVSCTMRQGVRTRSPSVAPLIPPQAWVRRVWVGVRHQLCLLAGAQPCCQHPQASCPAAFPRSGPKYHLLKCWFLLGSRE